MTNRNKVKAATAASKTPAAKKEFSLIPGEKLTMLYATMLKCRLLDQRVQSLLAQGALRSSYTPSAGQEAAIVGVAIDLLPEDAIGPSHLDLIAGFVQSAPLDKLLGELIAGKNGGPPSQVAGHASLIAAGMALENKRQKNNRIAVSFLDAESIASDCCREALHFAGANRLPILFVSQSGPRAEDVSATHGIPRITVDGNDVVAVYRVACEAITHARKDHGPTLIECTHYPANLHRSAGRNGGRTAAEAVDSTHNDPIHIMEKYLSRKHLFHEEMKAEIVTGFNKKLDAAVDLAVRPLHRSRRKSRAESLHS